MKYIKLSKNKRAIVDDEDFDLVNQFKWCCNTENYAMRSSKDGNSRWMHRLIINTPKGKQTDHINGNRLDNRKSNLRICTHQQNNFNRLKQKGTSKYKGVSWCKALKKWTAAIKLNYKAKNLGYFIDEKSAALAYQNKAKELFGNFAR